MEGTVKSSANYVPLSPITFLERSAIVYSDRFSLIYGNHVKFTWKQTLERCTQLASALTTHIGISPGDVGYSSKQRKGTMFDDWDVSVWGDQPISGWMSNPPAVSHPTVSGSAIGLGGPSMPAALKHPRTPPTNPSLDYPSADSDHVAKRTRPMGITDEDFVMASKWILKELNDLQKDPPTFCSAVLNWANLCCRYKWGSYESFTSMGYRNSRVVMGS